MHPRHMKSIVNFWKNLMLACLCNYGGLYCSSQAIQNLAWRRFMAHLLDDIYTNKIDLFTYYDGDRETKFEIYFYDKSIVNIVS